MQHLKALQDDARETRELTNYLHYEALYQKAYDRAFSKHCENYFMMKMSQPDYVDSLIAGTSSQCLVGNYLRKFADEQPEAKWFSCLITVNPRPDIDMTTFIKAVDKLMARTFIKSYLYAYEQRSTDPLNGYSGYHCHILLYRDNQKDLNMSHLKRNVKNTFKHICDVNNSGCLNFKTTNMKSTPNFVKYITGEKGDSEGKQKAEKQAVDILFRKFYKLEPSYSRVCECPDVPVEMEDEDGEA